MATHSLRKSFAQRAYDNSGDIYLVQEMLGHASVETTQEYLGVSYRKMQQTVGKMETQAEDECNTFRVLYHSPQMISDDTLLLEVIKRGLITPEAIEPQERKIAAGGDSKMIPIDRARQRKRR